MSVIMGTAIRESNKPVTSFETASGSSEGGGQPGIITYDYTDEKGNLLYQVVRNFPKRFVQRRPVGHGEWSYKLDGVRRVPYRLTEILSDQSRPVFIVEGEKDADRLAKEGLIATTNSGGAGKWLPEFGEYLRDRDIIILPDNDPPGRNHAIDVATKLSGVARSIKVVDLPDLEPKGDVSDWLADHHSIDDLQALVNMAPEYQPEEDGPCAVIETTPRVKPPDFPERGAYDDPHRLATAYIRLRATDDESCLPTIRFWRGQWWRWDGSRYRSVPKEDLRAELNRFMKSEYDSVRSTDQTGAKLAKITHQSVSNMMDALASLVIIPSDIEPPTYLSGDNTQPRYLGFENGVVNVDQLISGGPVALYPHTPDFFSLCSLPYAFTPTAECPQWEEFINEVLEGDPSRIALLQELFGYCLIPDTSMQTFFAFVGEGANGKSVTTDVLTAMVGRENVSNVPLESFGDRFQLTSTLGKLVNISPETSPLARVHEGALKAFVGGDQMHFDRKGLDPIEVRPTARVIIHTNGLPKFHDRTIGLWRRLMIIPYRVTIPPERQDPHLAEKLIRELPGIAQWAIAGLGRLMKNGRFTSSPLGEEAVQAHRLESNPARGFLLDNCREDPCAVTDCGKLYAAYTEYCRASSFPPIPATEFGKEVKRVFPSVKKVRRGPAKGRVNEYENLAMS